MTQPQTTTCKCQEKHARRPAGTVPPDQLSVYYYYHRDADGHIDTTCCFVHDANGRYAAGMSLRNPGDNPNRSKGRHYAYTRALNAYYRSLNLLAKTPDGELFFKSRFNYPLPEIEQKMLASGLARGGGACCSGCQIAVDQGQTA